MHKPPGELRQLLNAVRSDPSTPPGSPQRLAALRELTALCPAFVPGLLASSRAMLLNKDEVDNPEAYFAQIEHTLRDAVAASDEDAAALLELAHFTDVVRDALSEAEALFTEAARRALNQLEEAWAGQISVLGQQDKLEAALAVADLARKILPHSSRIAEAVEFARQCASR